MLTEFEMNEAKDLQEKINQTFSRFIFDPTIRRDIDRLDELQGRCNHIYQGNRCVYCGKEEK